MPGEVVGISARCTCGLALTRHCDRTYCARGKAQLVGERTCAIDIYCLDSENTDDDDYIRNLRDYIVRTTSHERSGLAEVPHEGLVT